MAFDARQQMMNLKGKDYLPVAGRLIWFREDHPEWSIVTRAIEINPEKQYAIFHTEIRDEEGRVIGTGTKMEDARGFGDWLEKAETGSVGRALLMCGYGTAAAAHELEEGDRLADTPQPPRHRAEPDHRPQENVRRGPGPGMPPRPVNAQSSGGGNFPG